MKGCSLGSVGDTRTWERKWQGDIRPGHVLDARSQIVALAARGRGRGSVGVRGEQGEGAEGADVLSEVVLRLIRPYVVSTHAIVVIRLRNIGGMWVVGLSQTLGVTWKTFCANLSHESVAVCNSRWVMECTSYINISKNTDEVDHRVPVILPLSSGQRSGCRWHLELWQSPEDGTDELTIMGSSLRATWLWKVNVKLTYAARGSLIFTQDMVKWYNSAPSEHLFVTRDGNPAVYTKSIGSYRPGLGCLMYPASGEQVTLKHQFCNVEKVDSNHFAIETSENVWEVFSVDDPHTVKHTIHAPPLSQVQFIGNGLIQCRKLRRPCTVTIIDVESHVLMEMTPVCDITSTIALPPARHYKNWFKDFDSTF